MGAANLGPWSGVYRPGYQLLAYKNGDPSKPIRGIDWRSATRISTSKTLDDIVGTFDITLKDSRARELVGPMDVFSIRLRGHNQGFGTVLRGVADYSGPSDSASVTSAQQDTSISGRCTGKYLQVNSMFLPVWDPQANLPTALTFGTGDASSKLGVNVNASTPRAIFGYIFDHFVVGKRNRVGLSGTPNARFWLSRKDRFEWVRAEGGKPFSVPFVQFDEDTCDTALTRLTIQGFTEGWVDELGNVVYRRPGWDQPASWLLHTSGLIDDSLQDSDIGLATYVEVFPGALPAVSSGVAQALLSGRAPIPSDYVTGLQKSGFTSIADPSFIIDTDSSGEPTANGLKNWYYQRQRKYGLRPYQITSPLLASREQAQAQAEGLLRFMCRWQKSGTVTIPGEPNVRVGETIHIVGKLRGQRINRTYYIVGVAHEYVEGDHYTTTLTLAYGRDPWDPHWPDVALPQFSASQLAEASGILNTTNNNGSHHNSSFTTPPSFSGTPNSRGVINPIPGFTITTWDEGLDVSGPNNGAPIYAPADCVITDYVPAFYNPGSGNQPLVLYRFTTTPPDAPTSYFYVSETINPASTAKGTHYRQGDVIATYLTGFSNNCEIGWGSPTASSRRHAQEVGQPDQHFGSRPPGSTWGNSFQDYFGIA